MGGGDAELAADALWQAGAVAIEERPVAGGTVVLVAAGPEGPDRLVAAVAGRWPVDIVAVDLDAALDAWRPHARAVTAGRFTVRPPWVAAEPADPNPPAPAPAGRHGATPHGATSAPDPTGPAPTITVEIDPGRAFGSGSHASTRLALAALSDVVGPGHRVLDVGCGSGVLAIAALLAGAATAVGVDIDPAACDATRANARRNGVADRLTVGTQLPPPGGPGFDVVVANMLAPTLIELAPAVEPLAVPGGRLVLSGLLTTQCDAVLAAHPGRTVAATYAEDDWLALVLAAGEP